MITKPRKETEGHPSALMKSWFSSSFCNIQYMLDIGCLVSVENQDFIQVYMNKIIEHVPKYIIHKGRKTEGALVRPNSMTTFS